MRKVPCTPNVMPPAITDGLQDNTIMHVSKQGSDGPSASIVPNKPGGGR